MTFRLSLTTTKLVFKCRACHNIQNAEHDSRTNLQFDMLARFSTQADGKDQNTQHTLCKAPQQIKRAPFTLQQDSGKSLPPSSDTC